MPNLLAIETSSHTLSVALQKGAEPLREGSIEGFLTHAENLLPLIGKLLKEAHLGIADIDTYLIGRGPGSFTGLRIGFATLKGFMASGAKPCYGASSFDLIAENVTASLGQKLAVCLDAHRQKFYYRPYERIVEGWKPLEEAAILELESLARALPEGSFVAGDALCRHRDTFKKAFAAKKISLLEEKSWYPKASALILYYAKKLPGLTRLEDPADLLPLYLRLSEPEEKLQNQNGRR